MRIGIIGLNEISIFYGIVLSQHNHEIIFYKDSSSKTSFTINEFLLEEEFFNKHIKKLNLFESLEFENIDLNIVEKFLFKEETQKNKFIKILNYKFKPQYSLEKIPNVETVEMKTTSLNQIKLMEDILILDTRNQELIKQLDLIKFSNWLSLEIEVNDGKNLQITKSEKYSIFSSENKKTVYINTNRTQKKKVLKIISNNFKDYKIISEKEIKKFNTYAYKNMLIINSSLEEYNNPFRDYSLIFQIIEISNNKNIYSNLDIYSDIKGKVI